jgi:DNA polymerase
VTGFQDLYTRISGCTACDLCRRRTHAVPGDGLENAEIMLVGEGPGFHEDQQARPFVGPAGKFLDELLASIGYKRSDVYITNVVKCRPPENRDPLPNEIEACRGFLEEQIERIRPRVIVTLGRYSLAWFFPRDTISKVHGHVRERDGRVFVHMYHPAAALHAGGLRKVIQDEFQRIPAALERARRSDQPVSVAVESAAEQMRLF